MATVHIPKPALKRLQKDYMELIKEPLPYITAHPLDENILEWHYVIAGPNDSPYSGGIYHGTLVFPTEFPFKPPAIKMLTPNGRFQCDTRLCLTISDYHPESWSPLWTVGSVLNGLFSFMLEDKPTFGSIETSDEQKKQFAEQSWNFNLQDRTFCRLFPDLAQQARDKLKKTPNSVTPTTTTKKQEKSK